MIPNNIILREDIDTLIAGIFQVKAKLTHIALFPMDRADAPAAKAFNIFSYHMFCEHDFIAAITV